VIGETTRFSDRRMNATRPPDGDQVLNLRGEFPHVGMRVRRESVLEGQELRKRRRQVFLLILLLSDVSRI